jgi:hypothetical protein
MAKKATGGIVEARKEPSALVRYWTDEINSARKREKEFRKEGERIRKIFSGEAKRTTPFNILYSNTETMSPALYSATPKPIVQRRFKDADPMGRAAAMAGQRALEFMLDTNIEEYETFDSTMRDAVQDALLPGRGVSRVKYEAEIAQIPGVPANESDAEEPGEVEEPDEPETIEEKSYETVCTETVCWNRVYFGYAKKWSRVPWVAFEHYVEKDEAVRLFGEPVANKMRFSKGTEKENDTEWDGATRAPNEGDMERKTCLVYEVWRRKGKQVCFIAPTYFEGYLKEEDDPLQLSGFFPTPKPLRFLTETEDLTPRALYLIYENQANELNRISVRINRIVEAIKVRGAYDGSLGDTLGQILKQEDNAMIATENASEIALERGLDSYIWFMPLDKLIVTLQELIRARGECKQVIYEVTGLADILRGASDANETLGAQQIKNQWASLRIRVMQNEVRRYARDLLRMMLEVAAKHFSPETFAKMTGLPYVTQAQKMQAKALLAAAAQTMPQGVPPMQDPAIAEAQKVLQAPDWESVQALLADDLSRAYRIDIETNSTVEINEQEDKENISEAMGALGQFIGAVTPLVEKGVMPFEAAQSMLLAIVRRFRFGTEVEEQIKSMQPPKPQGNPAAEIEKAKLDADRAKAEMKNQADRAAASEKLAFEAQRAQTDRLIAQDNLAADRAMEEIRAQAEVAKRNAELASEERLARERMAMEERLALEKAAMEVSGKVLAETIKAHEAQETMAQEQAEGAAHEAEEMNPSNIMQQVLALQGEMLAAIKATRKRTPVRVDGEIAYVVEEPM